MTDDLKAKWIAALRSGDYKQGRVYLIEDDRFCCLGVLCRIADIDMKPENQFASAYVELRAHISGQRWDLMYMNDLLGKSFAEIAEWIETNIPTEEGAQ